jgi:hypothetical protein
VHDGLLRLEWPTQPVHFGRRARIGHRTASVKLLNRTSAGMRKVKPACWLQFG